MTSDNRYRLDELITLEQAAERLELNPRTARKRALERNIGRMFGQTRVLTPADLDRLAQPGIMGPRR